MASASCRASAAALLLASLLAACGRDAPPPGPAEPSAEERAQLDRGVGLMGQYDFAAAREIFAALAARHPGWDEARIDLALATMNRQQEGDERAAAEILAPLQADVRAAYVLALLKLHAGEPREAEPLFARVLQADANDAYARYFLAQSLLAQGRAEEALAQFDGAAKLDPQLRSAVYGASQALARLGRTEEAAKRLAEFERTRNNPLARLAEFKYTRMGAKAQAAPSAVRAAPAALPAGALFAEPVELTRVNPPYATAPVASMADIDGDGQVDLYLPLGRDAPGLVRLGPGLDSGDSALTRIGGTDFAAWGDFDNDGLTDVLLCASRGSSTLVMQGPRGEWKTRDVPALRKLGAMRDCAVFDADHDGDLDLFLVTARGERILLSNNGDGTFRPLTLPAAKGRALQVLAADLDDDRDLDLVILHEGSPHEVLANDRAWAWKPAAGFEAFVGEPAIALASARLEPAGDVHLYALTPQLGVRAWQRDASGHWAGATVIAPGAAASPTARAQIAVADIDGDGVPELVATTAGGLGVWSLGAQGAQPRLSIDDATIVSWTLAPLDAKGPALVTYHRDGSVRLRSAGPGRYPFAWIALTGADGRSPALRSNASGIGARIAARAGGRGIVVDSQRRDSGPGQSLTPLAIGTGGAARIDYLAVDWPDGVFQTEVGVAPAQLHRIAETQRQLSSCPLIFAWNGEKIAFVSDFLGVGGLGYLVAPGEYAPPRPWENFLFPEGAVKPRDGRLIVKIGEPMEEAAYIDSVKLVAHDLPEGWDMALDERMGISGPKVTGRPFYFRRQSVAARATNDRGEDVTARLRTADRDAAPPGAHDRRFIGRLANDHVLTLEFDSDLDAGPGEALLVADGWIEYPYSQTMFAAWQARADYRAPTLEAKGADGRWRTVLKEFGYPAGMPRRMAVPLPRLPRGTRALRLTTNQEIYWDRIAVAWAERAPVATHELALAGAELRRAGFPRRTTGAQQQPGYDYARRDPLWDTRVQSGFYTAFGDAAALVASADDALAILGPGEELHLEYEGLPGLTAGMARRYVLETRGWAKDMDLYTRDGETVGPLPTTGKNAANREVLHQRFNTRFASGR